MISDRNKKLKAKVKEVWPSSLKEFLPTDTPDPTERAPR
jgi:hypothetical protein